MWAWTVWPSPAPELRRARCWRASTPPTSAKPKPPARGSKPRLSSRAVSLEWRHWSGKSSAADRNDEYQRLGTGQTLGALLVRQRIAQRSGLGSQPAADRVLRVIWLLRL